MTIYQAMQLNVKNLKKAIHESSTKKEKQRYILAMVLRNICCLIFCIIFITLVSTIFGQENSYVGIIGVLAILSLRFTDLDFKISQSIFALIGSLMICVICPHLANQVSIELGLIINFTSLLSLLILTCHQVEYANHFTFILGYILLWGNDVNGNSFINRIIAMFVVAIMTIIIYIHCHYKQTTTNTLKTILQDFFTFDQRTIWYLKLSSAIALVFFFGKLLNFSRPMWIAFACMSVTNFDHQQINFKFKYRTSFAIIGSLIFGLLFTFIPKDYLSLAGILGGILVGFSGSYQWQTAFNCFGAIAITIDMFGFYNAIVIRIIANLAGSTFSYVYHHLFEKAIYLLTNSTYIIERN